MSDQNASGNREGRELAVESDADGTETVARRDDRRAGSTQRVGRFDVSSILGSGAFGDVYLARDPQLQREVALKVPRKGSFREGEEAERFMREARSAAALQHPNICPVFEVFEEDDHFVIVMGYIRGRRLDQFFEPGKPLPELQAARVVARLAKALQYAHDKGIVHRDLKPANIIVDADRKEPVIMDFGLARREDSGDAALTRSGDILGSPAYMSPEQARGRVSEIGPHSDIYSLGVILYELLCGERPFGGSVAQVIGCIIHVETPPPSTRHAGIDAELEAICLKAMSKEKADRYSSMREFAAALSQWVKRQRGSADDAGAVSQAGDIVESRERAADSGPAGSRSAGSGTPGSMPDAAGVSISPFETVPSADVSAITATVAREDAAKVAREEAAVDIVVSEHEASGRVGARRRTGRGGVFSGRRGLLIGLAGAAVLLAAIVFSIRTPKGTVQFTLTDPTADVTITVDGDNINVKTLDQALHLEVGDHELKVTAPGFETLTQNFTVRKDNNTALEIALLPANATATSPATSPASATDTGTLTGDRVSNPELVAWERRVNGLQNGAIGSAEVESLRKELIGEFAKRAGTPEAADLASLMCRLRWPLDQMSRSDIDRYELSRAVNSRSETGSGNSDVDAHDDDGSADPGLMTELVGIVGDSRLKHWGTVIDVVVTPDDTTVISAGTDSAIRFHDLRSGRETSVINVFPARPRQLALSPNGAVLAIAASVPDSSGGSTGGSGSTGSSSAAKPASDGVRLWQLTGKPTEPQLVDMASAPQCVAFSPDGRRLACGTEDGAIRILNVPVDGSHATIDGSIEPFVGHSGAVLSVAFSPDGTRVLSGGADKTVRVWDVVTSAGEVIGQHAGAVRSVCFDRAAQIVASASSDRSVRIWRLADRQLVHTLQDTHDVDGNKSAVVDVAFHPVDDVLVSAGHDGAVRYWDPATGSARGGFVPNTDARITRNIEAFAFSRDGTRLVTGDSEGAVRVIDPSTRKETLASEIRHTGQTAGTHHGLVTLDGRRFLSSGWDARLVVWRPESDAPMLQLEDRFLGVHGLVGNDAGTIVATATQENTKLKRSTVRSWNLETLQAFPGITGMWPGCLALSPDGRRVAVGAWDTDRVTVHDVATGAQLGEPFHSRHELGRIEFSADGRLIATVDRGSRLIRLWDAKTHQAVRTIDDSVDAVSDLAFPRDGRWMLSVSSRSTDLRITDLQTFNTRVLRPIVPPSRLPGIVTLNVSPDGRVAAVVSSDRSSVSLIRLSDGEELWSMELPLRGCSVQRAFLTFDQRHVVTANRNGTFYIFRLPEDVTSRALTTTSDQASPARSQPGEAVRPSITPGQGVAAAEWLRLSRLTSEAAARPFDHPDVVALRRELTDRRLATMGSPDVITATRLLSQLASPLDTLTDERTAPTEFRAACFGADRDTFPELAGVLGSSHLKHWGTVTDVEFSRDGTLLVTASTDRTAVIRDAASGVALRVLAPHPRGVLACSFSSDGRFVATACERDQKVESKSPVPDVMIWDATTGELKHTLTGGHLNSVGTVSWIPGSHRLVSIDNARTEKDALHAGEYAICVWGADSGELHSTFRCDAESEPTALAIHPEGQLLAVATRNGQVQIREVSTLALTAVQPAGRHDKAVYSVAFRGDGQLLASGGDDGRILLIEPDTGRVQQTLTNGSPVRDVCFAGSSRLVSGGSGGINQLWDLADLNSVTSRRLPHRSASTTSIAVSVEQELIACGSTRAGVTLTKFSGETADRSETSHTFGLRLAEMSLDGSVIATLDGAGRNCTWSTESFSFLAQRSGYPLDAGPRGLAVHPRGELVFDPRHWSGFPVDRFDARTGKYVSFRFPFSGFFAHTAAVSPEGDRIAIGTWKPGRVLVWNFRTGQQVVKFDHPGGNAAVMLLEFSPDGRTLSTNQYGSHSIRLWDATSGAQTGILTAHSSQPESIDWHPDGTRLLSSDNSGGGELKVWDVATKRVLRELITPEIRATHGSSHGGKFSPTGNLIAAQVQSGVLMFWNAVSFEPVGTLRFVPEHVSGRCVQFFFSPDGRHIFTANANGTLYALHIPQSILVRVE